MNVPILASRSSRAGNEAPGQLAADSSTVILRSSAAATFWSVISACRQCEHACVSIPGGWFVGDSRSTLSYHRAGRASEVRWLLRRSGGFRTVQLNVVGWSALLVPSALLGALIARLLEWSVIRGVAIGAIAAWRTGLVVDGARWRASSITYNCPDLSRAVLDRLVDDLREVGVHLSIELNAIESESDRPVWKICTRMRHRRLLDRRLADLTARPPFAC
jgi:hypothetical protein